VGDATIWQANREEKEREPGMDVNERLAPTGIDGLDVLLGGGLPRHHMYLLQGEAGTGKTTMGMQFLVEGVRAGETALFISLAEAREDLLEVAASHGWTLEGVDIVEVTAEEAAKRLADTQTVFPTSEVELSEVTDEIVERLRETRPQRVLFDAVSELRMLADHPVRYRRQILALRDALAQIKATALLTDTGAVQGEERVLDSLVHGIIRLERWAPPYGIARRRLEVAKVRGRSYQEGWHDMNIVKGGVQVFPRPRRTEEAEHAEWEQLSSGIAELDALLGGGLEMGTASLIVGSSGTGKSSVASLFVRSAMEKGLHGAVYIFDERPETFYKRSADIGVPLRSYVEEGQLLVRGVETGEFAPGEFAEDVRRLVEETDVKVVVIDSLTGYFRAMPDENLLINQMHDLLNYLSAKGVLSILIVTHHGLIGELAHQDLDLSYLSDTVILVRHFEARGTLHKAISVVKKRHGWHERTIRELVIREGGIQLSEPLQAFRGVMTGNPDFRGERSELLGAEGE
jgi:circadian clock protein KaiC